MFIIHGKKSLSDVLLLLSTSEARELKNDIEQLLASEDMHHLHISSDDYQKEITISLLDGNEAESYHADIRAIIDPDDSKA